MKAKPDTVSGASWSPCPFAGSTTRGPWPAPSTKPWQLAWADTLYGALDFIVTPSGEWIFLELNPNGQWAWITPTRHLMSNDARIRLGYLGYTPTVVTGNGAHGYPPNAPYDAILATCALRRIPADWLTQAAPGTRIVAPLATGLIALEVTSPEHASGRFLTPGGFFMPLRDTHQNDKPTTPSPGPRRDPRPTDLGPLQTFYEDHLRFLLTVALPDVRTGQHGPAFEDLTICDTTGSTVRLDRTENGALRS
ncbi:MAG: hypothetical protein ACT4NY_30645 [Pseudonocardiales bacterium]